MQTVAELSSQSGIAKNETPTSAVSWPAVAAGATASAALTLLLYAFGAGIGLSSVSVWSDSGVSASTFKVATGIYLIIAAVMSSSVGGYLAGRLRTTWFGVHTHEVYFRDTAHGFLSWAFATIISASVLASAAAHIAGGAAQGLGQGIAQSRSGAADLFVDKVMRPGLTAAPAFSETNNANDRAFRGELSRLFIASVRDGRDVSSTDRIYVAQAVAIRTGLSQAAAEQRVSETIAEARAAADAARKAAAQLALWLTAAMLFGAFAASLAATEGGGLRDGTWSYDQSHVRQP